MLLLKAWICVRKYMSTSFSLVISGQKKNTTNEFSFFFVEINLYFKRKLCTLMIGNSKQAKGQVIDNCINKTGSYTSSKMKM